MMEYESPTATSLQQPNIKKYNLFGHLPNSNGVNAKVSFSEKKRDQEGKCIFIALGATREQVAACLRTLIDRDEIREALAEEIQQAFETTGFISKKEWEELLDKRSEEIRKYNNWIQKTFGDFAVRHPVAMQILLSYFEGQDQDKHHKSISAILDQARRPLSIVEKEIKFYFRREGVIKAYITAFHDRRLPLGYKSALLYAKHNSISLYIWQREPNHAEQLKLLHYYKEVSDKKTVDILTTNGYTHFNLLVEKPPLQPREVLEERKEELPLNLLVENPALQPKKILEEIKEKLPPEIIGEIKLCHSSTPLINDPKAEKFFDCLFGESEHFPLKNHLENHKAKVVFVTVSHLVCSLPPFIHAIQKIAPIAAIIPKGSSRREYEQEKASYKRIKTAYASLLKNELNREVLNNSQKVIEFFEDIREQHPDHKIIIIDEGGYFAPFVEYIMTNPTIDEWLKTCILSINEITKNGHLRYLKLFNEASKASNSLSFPISSIAESSIKKKEDIAVGAAIVRSLDTVLDSDRGTALEFEEISILGCGIIGTAVVKSACKRAPRAIRLYDTNLENAEMAAEMAVMAGRVVGTPNVKIYTKWDDFLKGASILISATGSRALKARDIELLPNDAVIACVTSRDDELDHAAITVKNPGEPNAVYEYQKVKDPHMQYTSQYHHLKTGKKVNLILDGNAVNFLANSAVGPGIYAVLASTLVCAFRAYHHNSVRLDQLNVLSEEDIHNIEETHESIYKIETTIFGLDLLNSAPPFVGREKELKQLKETFQGKEEQYNHSRSIIIGKFISGLGGIGKSSLVREYVGQCIHDNYYDYIIIFNAIALEKGFRNLAENLKLRGAQLDADILRVVQSVYQALLPCDRILIIYDNVENYDVLTGFLPPENPGYIVHWIATTCNREFSDIHLAIHLGAFTPENARDYILEGLQLAPSEAGQKNASLLSKELHFFPLALSQAIAYIKKQNCSIIECIKSYRDSPALLLDRVVSGSKHPQSLYATYCSDRSPLSILQASGDASAINILEYCAYLGSKNIPEFLLAALLQKDMASVNLALEKLSNYSLIEREPANYCVNVPELVQKIIQLRMLDPSMMHTSVTEVFTQILNTLHSFTLRAAYQFNDQLDADAIKRIFSLEAHITIFKQYYQNKRYLSIESRNNLKLFWLLFQLGRFQCFESYNVAEALQNVLECRDLANVLALHLPLNIKNSIENMVERLSWYKRFTPPLGPLDKHIAIISLAAYSDKFPQAENEIERLSASLRVEGHVIEEILAILCRSGPKYLEKTKSPIKIFNVIEKYKQNECNLIATEALRGLLFALQGRYRDQLDLLESVFERIKEFEETYEQTFDRNLTFKVLFGLVAAEGMLGYGEHSLHYFRHLWTRVYEIYDSKLNGILNMMKNFIGEYVAYRRTFNRVLAPCINFTYLMLAGAYQAFGDSDSAEECVRGYQAASPDISVPSSLHASRCRFFAVPRSGICLVPKAEEPSAAAETFPSLTLTLNTR